MTMSSTPSLTQDVAGGSAPDSGATDSAAAATAADSVAELHRRYPRAFASNGKPLWTASGFVSTPREAHVLRTVTDALPLLLALWWVALSVRALAVDRRRRGSVIVLFGVLGAIGWAVLGPLGVVGFTAALDDRYGMGRSLVASLVAACLVALVMSWGIADPRLESSGFRSPPAHVIVGTEQPTTPTVPDHLRPGLLTLCRYTLIGVALGLFVIGVAYGFLFDTVHPGVPKWIASGIAACGVAAGLRDLSRARNQLPPGQPPVTGNA